MKAVNNICDMMTVCKDKESVITQHAKQQQVKSERQTRSKIKNVTVPPQFKQVWKKNTPSKRKNNQKKKTNQNRETQSTKKARAKTLQKDSNKAKHTPKAPRDTLEDSDDSSTPQLKSPQDSEIKQIDKSDTTGKLIPVVTSGMEGGPVMLYKTILPLAVIDQSTDHMKLALKAVLTENRHLATPALLGYSANWGEKLQLQDTITPNFSVATLIIHLTQAHPMNELFSEESMTDLAEKVTLTINNRKMKKDRHVSA